MQKEIRELGLWPYLHEAFRTAGKVASTGQTGITRVRVRVDETLVETANGELVEDYLG